MKLSAAAILSLAGLASSEVYIKEQFDDVSSFGSTPTRIGPNFSTTIKSDSPGLFFFNPTGPNVQEAPRRHLHLLP